MKIVSTEDETQWKEVGQRGRDIKIDLETAPLQIQTDSLIGSGDFIRVKFFTKSHDLAGSISVAFSDPMRYKVGYCNSSFLEFTGSISECDTQTKIWTIERDTAWLTLSCNDVELVRYFYSSSRQNSCKHWSHAVAKIVFRGMNVSPTDNASDMYRAKPSRKTGKQSLNQTQPNFQSRFENNSNHLQRIFFKVRTSGCFETEETKLNGVVLRPPLPAEPGTVMEVRCKTPAHVLVRGDKEITCAGDNILQFSVLPECEPTGGGRGLEPGRCGDRSLL